MKLQDSRVRLILAMQALSKLIVGKPDALLRDGAESHTRPAREKQGALMLSLSISRQNLTHTTPSAMAGLLFL